MRSEDLRQLVRRQPFQPLRLSLSNGQVYEVRHPELAMVGRSTLLLGRPATAVEFLPPGSAASNGIPG